MPASLLMMHRRGVATVTFSTASPEPSDILSGMYTKAAGMFEGVGVMDGVAPDEMDDVGVGVSLAVAVSVGTADSVAEIDGDGLADELPLALDDVEGLVV